jgi:hypothetical protein
MICVTVSLYALAHELGAADAYKEFERQLAKPDRDSLPCVRAIARLRGLDELVVRCDLSGANVAKMRSRAASAAQASGADVWVSIDDDVEATYETLGALLEAAKGGPRVVIAPCWLRGRGQQDAIVNVALDTAGARRELDGARVLPAIAGGFGLVAITREALELALAHSASLSYRDDDGELRVGLFHEDLSDGKWWGEDLSFFRRLPAAVSVEALATGHTCHAGHVLPLDHLEECPMMSLMQGFRLDAPKPSPATSPATMASEAPTVVEGVLEPASATAS